MVDMLVNETDLMVLAALTRAFANLMKQMPPLLLDMLVGNGNLLENILSHIEKMNESKDGRNLNWLCVEITHQYIELLHVLGLLCSMRQDWQRVFAYSDGIQTVLRLHASIKAGPFDDGNLMDPWD